MRVIKTLRHRNVYVNERFFLDGVEKAKVLQAFRPHIFFDDQDTNLEPAAKHVPSAKASYQTKPAWRFTHRGRRSRKRPRSDLP
jgi:5'-nucleotidase